MLIYDLQYRSSPSVNVGNICVMGSESANELKLGPKKKTGGQLRAQKFGYRKKIVTSPKASTSSDSQMTRHGEKKGKDECQLTMEWPFNSTRLRLFRSDYVIKRV